MEWKYGKLWWKDSKWEEEWEIEIEREIEIEILRDWDWMNR